MGFPLSNSVGIFIVFFIDRRISPHTSNELNVLRMIDSWVSWAFYFPTEFCGRFLSAVLHLRRPELLRPRDVRRQGRRHPDLPD